MPVIRAYRQTLNGGIGVGGKNEALIFNIWAFCF